MRFGASSPVFGLVGGASYNITMTHRTTNAAAAADFINREIIIVPAP